MPESTRDDEPVKERVHDHWDRRADTFDQEPEHGIHSDAQHDRWLEVLREWTGEDPLRVLDVGCGTGVISLLLAELGHAVVGIDFAPGMLAEAQAKARRTEDDVVFGRGDAEALPLPADAVELVTARHLVWTLPQPTAALAEWQRVLEPGGAVVLMEGYWDHDAPWDEYVEIHEELPLYDGRPPEELRDLLQQAGLEEVRYEPLMDATLRGGPPEHEYYIMRGEVPSAT